MIIGHWRFLILNSCLVLNHVDGDLGTTQRMGVLGKGFSFLDTQFWSGDKCKYFIVETTNFIYLKYHKFYFVILFYFNKTWDRLRYFLLKFSINKRSTNFYSDFHIHVVWNLYNIKNIKKSSVIIFLDFLHYILKYTF